MVNLRKLVRTLAQVLVNQIMDAEAGRTCKSGTNCRYGYRERKLATCTGEITICISKPRSGSFSPEDIVGRHRCVD